MIKVINGKQDGFVGENKIYIGRENKYYGTKKSPLFNRFKLGQHGTREEVVELYKKDLVKKIKQWKDENITSPEVEEVLRIAHKVKNNEDVTLSCWCSPLACHGDIIVKVVNLLITKGII